MKLFNVVVVYDVYCVAETEDAARKAVMDFIQNEHLPPSEQNALEARNDREIRAAWENEPPIVGADVSDDDFEKLRGKTTMQVFAQLHKKPDKVSK